MTNPGMRLVLCAVCLVLVAGQCRQAEETGVGQEADGTLRLGATETTETVTRGVSPGDRTLVFDGYRGAVRLRGTGAGSAELSFTKHGRGGSSESAGEALGEVTITESGTAEAYTYEVQSDDEDRTSVDVTGTVPQNTALRVTKDSGPVEIRGILGPLTVQHQYGDVQVEGAGGPLEVSVKTGDVRASFRRVPADATISLRTANGDVTLALPPDASVQIDAQTNAGVVRTQGLSFGPQQLTPANAGARYTAQIGSGAAVVELNTENGVITLTAADTSAIESPAPTPPDTAATEPASPDTTAPDTTQDTAAPDTAASPPAEPDTTAPAEPSPNATPDTATTPPPAEPDTAATGSAAPDTTGEG